MATPIKLQGAYKYTDTNNNQQVDYNEVSKQQGNPAAEVFQQQTVADVMRAAGGTPAAGDIDLNSMFAQLGASKDWTKSGADVGKALAEAKAKLSAGKTALIDAENAEQKIEGEIVKLKKEMKKEMKKASGPQKTALQAKLEKKQKTLAVIKNAKSVIKARLKALVIQQKSLLASTNGKKVLKNANTSGAAKEVQNLVKDAETHLNKPKNLPSQTGAKAGQTAAKAANAAAAGTGAQQQQAGSGLPNPAGAKAGAGKVPFGVPQGSAPLGVSIDDAMMQQFYGNIMRTAQTEGLEAALKNKNKSQQMMMMFFYLSNQASSGDMGSMYQFMRFIAWMIGHDKAKQNVQMGQQLIKLQENSRELTQKLMDTNNYSETDKSVQADYQKVMTEVQSQQGTINTSQKLIAQMMEEFTQVSEMMTGMLKSILDARGRQMQMVSSWR